MFWVIMLPKGSDMHSNGRGVAVVIQAHANAEARQRPTWKACLICGWEISRARRPSAGKMFSCTGTRVLF